MRRARTLNWAALTAAYVGCVDLLSGCWQHSPTRAILGAIALAACALILHARGER